MTNDIRRYLVSIVILLVTPFAAFEDTSISQDAVLVGSWCWKGGGGDEYQYESLGEWIAVVDMVYPRWLNMFHLLRFPCFRFNQYNHLLFRGCSGYQSSLLSSLAVFVPLSQSPNYCGRYVGCYPDSCSLGRRLWISSPFQIMRRKWWKCFWPLQTSSKARRDRYSLEHKGWNFKNCLSVLYFPDSLGV